MRHIYLCGHTGSENRGCEAIVRSTADLLIKYGSNEIYATTGDIEYDKRVNLDNKLNLISYPKRSFLVRLKSHLRRKLFKNDTWGGRTLYQDIFSRVGANDVIFNVGGDTYCGRTPNLSYALNEIAEQNDIPTVFWGCSLDERVLSDKMMQRDINRYSAIVVRESKSLTLLKNIIKTDDKIYFACDPAFTLECIPTQLPGRFQAGNTVGINISPLVIANEKNRNDIMLQNVYTLIDNILSQTDMHICLIPHVYDSSKNTEDIRVLRNIYSRYIDEERVSLIEKDLSCSQLKYIISQCRFFIGARTHSMIAAYSTGVPALAISYSIKSLGIAKDILGDDTLYAVPWKNITTEDYLWKQFYDVIMINERVIRERYKDVLPEYIESVRLVLNEVLSKI